MLPGYKLHGWLTALALAALCLLQAGCARDVNGANPVAIYPNQVILSFKTRDNTLDPNLWYYFVFNYTETSTDDAHAPLNEISGDKRGTNWQMYVVYHPASNGQPEKWLTAQRPPQATIIHTAAGPSDAAVADFNGDNFNDIAVACEGAGQIQLITALSVIPNILLPTFYQDPVTVYNGTAPRFIFAGDFNGDSKQDLLVVDAGNGSIGPSLVLLAGQGDSTFVAGTPLALGGVPVDAVMDDFNGDTQPDLMLLESTGGGGSVVELQNAGGGTFTPTASEPVAGTPVQLASGELSGDTLHDIAVGFNGATSGTVQVFDSTAGGGLTAGPTLLAPALLRGVAVGDVDGTLDDVLVSYGDDAATGRVGAFFRNTTHPALTTAIANDSTGQNKQWVAMQSPAGFMLARDFGNDSRVEPVVLNGNATTGNQLSILRSDLVPTANGALSSEFAWNPDTVTYLTDQGPARLKAVNLNGDDILDLLTINAAPDSDGPSIGLFFGLGRFNFSSDDIYWTDGGQDAIVQDISSQHWALSHAVGPNSISLTIDPGTFLDLAQLEPPASTNGQPGFYVQFMVGTSAIDLPDNENQLGVITDYLQTPVAVPMVPGTTNDEQQTPLANQHIAPIPSQDINDWSIEVD